MTENVTWPTEIEIAGDGRRNFPRVFIIYEAYFTQDNNIYMYIYNIIMGEKGTRITVILNHYAGRAKNVR